MHHEDQQGVIHHPLMHLSHQRIDLARIEGVQRGVDQLIRFGILVVAPVHAGRCDLVRVEEADQGLERIGGYIGDVIG